MRRLSFWLSAAAVLVVAVSCARVVDEVDRDISVEPTMEAAFKRFKKLWARPDYFKTSVENLVQEMGDQISGILALITNPTLECSDK